jgi:hypothetical protein
MSPIRKLRLPAFLLSLGSCASIVTGTHDTIEVDSKPRGARFEASNGESGVTPGRVKVSDKRDIHFTFELEGYERATAVAENKASWWMLGNAALIVPFGAIPIFFDLFSQHGYVHDDKVTVVLTPVADGSGATSGTVDSAARTGP